VSVQTTTRHILNHPACTLQLDLDEDSGKFDLRFRSSPLPDPTFRRDLHRWAGQIGCGWARRIGYGKGSVVSIHFSDPKKAKGSYKGTSDWKDLLAGVENISK
jgi:hypothetical protein